MSNENSIKNNKPHSADYFGESSDFWWNKDFLQLMTERLVFSQVKELLD